MRLALKLAYRNLMGAKLRTWLNVFVLSLSFVVIIWQKGIINGWDQQAQRDTKDWEIGGGNIGRKIMILTIHSYLKMRMPNYPTQLNNQLLKEN